MSSKDYMSLTFKLSPLANKPRWDGEKTSRLMLFMRKYTPLEAIAVEFSDLDLGIDFRFSTKKPAGDPINEELCLLVESPLGKLNKSVFFPSDKSLILDSPDIDLATLKPGDLVGYAYPIYAMQPDIKFE